MSIIQKVIHFERHVAEDPEHGYDQIKRWGVNFDCSGLGITAWEQAGVLVKTAGATYTGDMKEPFLKCGFIDVTKSINLETGEGLVAGDQCLRIGHHTATCIGKNAKGIMEIVQAQSNEKGTTTGGKTGDQTGKEIFIKPYYNSLPHWDCILRYPEADQSLFAVRVVGDTWTHKTPDGNIESRDHVALASDNLTLGIAEVSGTWGRIQNQSSLWISINPDYAGVQRVGEVPPAVPKTIAVGTRYTLSGTGTSGSDGTGTQITKSVTAKCVKIMPGTRNPYGMNWTSGNWVDAYFPASAIK